MSLQRNTISHWLGANLGTALIMNLQTLPVRRQHIPVACCFELNQYVNTLRPKQDGRHFQTTFSNAFSWMKIFNFRLRFPWRLFPRFQLTIFQHWFRWWLGAGEATSHYLNQWWSVYWRIYASLGLNELRIAHLWQWILHVQHWKWNVVILMKFSSLAAP